MLSSKATTAPKARVLMVCLGNICRSPTAHGVMEKFINDKGLSKDIHVDSAGTGDWHIGENPDRRAVAAATSRGYDISQQIARQVQLTDFARFDYILAMDRTNLKDLKALSPQSFHPKLRLLLDFSDSEHESVPDPYYSSQGGFELVLDLVEAACTRLLDTIISEQQLSAQRD